MDPHHTLIIAASALHDAQNALQLCKLALPREAPKAGSGITDLRAEVIVNPVQDHIQEALRAIGTVIGEEAMLRS